MALVLSPPPAGLTPAAWNCAAVGLLMAVWWITEAVPIPATALVPLVALPLLGVRPIEAAAAPYANPVIFLFMGGFMIAQALQRWGLHRRIALGIIRLNPSRPTAVVAGFMVSAAFLSMWISNTATTLMMLPIALSVIELVHPPAETRRGRSNFAVALLLGIAYAASIGGMTTIIGTPTNALLVGFLKETYAYRLDFATWLPFGLPMAVIGLPLTFLLLTRVVYPIRLRQIPGGRAVVEARLRELGPMSRGERVVAAVFAATALLWVTSPLVARVLPGVSDAGIAIAAAVLLFTLPAGSGQRVLDWESAQRLPWGVLLLFGGGLSLASAVSKSGLATWLGTSVGGLSHWPTPLIVVLMCLLINFLTELTSNTATAAAFLPVLASVAMALNEDPLLLLVPATVSASCAFMLPVATPPNAIVYGSDCLTVPQMVRAGFLNNLLYVALVAVLAYTLMPLTLDVTPGVVPAWALEP
jgi:sodium-dependent dicarboxylate transporter 2/3/5